MFKVDKPTKFKETITFYVRPIGCETYLSLLFYTIWMDGKTHMFRKMGPMDVLTRNEDKPILKQILAMLKN